MTQGVLLSVGLIAILALALLIILLAGYSMFKNRKTHTQSNSKSATKVASFNVPPQETKETQQSIFRREDSVFGTLIVDGVEYTTYDEGLVTLASNGAVAMRIQIEGVNNQPRGINYVTVIENGQESTFYIGFNDMHKQAFQMWLNQQLYGSNKDVAIEFHKIMDELSRFNQLVAEKCIRKSGRKYVWTA
jgi:hypothetical protein